VNTKSKQQISKLKMFMATFHTVYFVPSLDAEFNVCIGKYAKTFVFVTVASNEFLKLRY
jgi:hypothetical protein